jgi:hypothetical protein
VKRNPEQRIEALQTGTGLLPFEDGELLAKSGHFQRRFVALLEEGAKLSEHCIGKARHIDLILTDIQPACEDHLTANFLFLLVDGILITDRRTSRPQTQAPH